MKSIVPIMLVLSVIFGTASCGKAELSVSPCSVTEEIAKELFMTLSLDRDSYSVGDVITVTVTVENRGDTEVDLGKDEYLCFPDYFDDLQDRETSLTAQNLISVTFMEGGIARNDLLPLKDYVSEELRDAVLASGEAITRTVEIFLDGTTSYSAPAAGAEWKVVGGIRIWSEEDECSDYKKVELEVPHDEGAIPSSVVNDDGGRELAVVLGKHIYTAIEDVSCEITFTNGGETPVDVYAIPDEEFDFEARLSRRKVYNKTSEGELVTPYSPSFEILRTLGAGESMTVSVNIPAERNGKGVLKQIEARDEYILYASVWYQTTDGEMQSIALEMPVPHERTETQIWSEEKGAYFSRLRITADNRGYNRGEIVPVTLDFFCIGDDFLLSSFNESDNKCFRVRLLSDDEVVSEVFLADTPDILAEGTRFTVQTELDTTGMNENETWSVQFTTISCAEKDIDGRGFEEHSAWLTLPRAINGSEVTAE